MINNPFVEEGIIFVMKMGIEIVIAVSVALELTGRKLSWMTGMSRR